MFIDTHCHLNPNMIQDDIEEIINRALEERVKKFICVGIDFESSQKCIELAEKYDEVYATVGIHPNDCQNAPENWTSHLSELALNENVVAIGETGIDLYRSGDNVEMQKQFFQKQIRIAQNNNLPVIVHNRESDQETAEIIQRTNCNNFVLHCYGSDADYAKKMVNIGAYISFTGNITYGDKEKEQALQQVPLDCLMLETDSPFLSPQKVRNKTNEPCYIPLIAEKIAELKDIDIKTIEKQTTKNAEQFYGLNNE